MTNISRSKIYVTLHMPSTQRSLYLHHLEIKLSSRQCHFSLCLDWSPGSLIRAPKNQHSFEGLPLSSDRVMQSSGYLLATIRSLAQKPKSSNGFAWETLHASLRDQRTIITSVQRRLLPCLWFSPLGTSYFVCRCRPIRFARKAN